MPSTLPFPPLFHFLILLTIITSTSPQQTTSSLPEYDDFISNCPNPNIVPLKPNDCFTVPNCCFVNGTILLTTRNICVSISDPSNQQLRIDTIEALSHLATNINLVCPNITKSIPSNCGKQNPTSIKDCTKDKTKEYDCCYIKVTDEQKQTWKGCMKFKNLDINTIGEAVRAAETRNAKLNVDCYGMYLNYSIINIMLFIFIYYVVIIINI